jgi:hypothetical protein
MLAHSFYLLSSIALAQCQTVVFDGRVPDVAVATDFDAASSLFDPEFTKGQGGCYVAYIESVC